MHKKHSRKAFSLIELSIVLLIVSILIAGTLGVSKTNIFNSKNKITKDRMDAVYKALGNFVAANKRLPCPALLTTIKNASGYGDEAATPGTCTGFTIGNASACDACQLVYGMVPLKALGLDPDMGEDGYGTKFSYVVDRRFTKTSTGTGASDGFEIIKAIADKNTGTPPVIINVLDASSSYLTTNALFLLISHGANKFSGWNANGSAQNPSSGVSNETTNAGDAAGNFDSNFFASSSSTAFDDIVLYKNKTQLVKDAGLEFIMCSGNEGTISSTSSSTCSGTGVTQTWGTAVYSTSNYPSSSNGGICSRTCGKYGLWGTPALTSSSSTWPAFFVNMTSNTGGGSLPSCPTLSGAGSTGNGTSYNPVVFNNELLDQGNNVSGGVFTAPVTGYYNFRVGLQAMCIGSANTFIRVTLVTTARNYRLVNMGPGARDTENAGSNDMLISGAIDSVPMTAGDTAQIAFSVDGSTRIVYLEGVATNTRVETFFTGTLAY